MGLLAGADRVEGTLFGNGERTGNVDIITLALNMYTHGVEPNLDLTDLPELVEVYERLTRMKVNARSPYSGQLVYAAFSGSHQDAIAKGMHYREENDPDHWNVPYIPIDPHDVGREYEGDVIRINSQSGKGGIAYLLEQNYGIVLPPKMRDDLRGLVKSVSDKEHKELKPDEVYTIFEKSYINKKDKLEVLEAHYTQGEHIGAEVTLKINGEPRKLRGEGNGRLDAVSNAIKDGFGLEYTISTYSEHAIEQTSKAKAASYVGITTADGKVYWGVGIHTDIVVASVKALVSAINNSKLL